MIFHPYQMIAYGRKLAGVVRRKFRSRKRAVWRQCLGFSFRIRNILLVRRPIRVNVAQVPFRLAPKGAVALDIWSGLRFERNELQFILEVFQPGMTFMDIGSNVGLFAIAAAKKLVNSRVYAFEPCSWTFQMLQQNIRLNNLSNVIPIRTALGDYKGEALLQINAPNKDGLNTIGSPSHSDCQVVASEMVPITTLDAFVAANGIAQVDVMKVDVEGAELLVFQGGQYLLQRKDAPLILYESYIWCTAGLSYHPVEIMWLLEDYGYSLFTLDSKTGQIARRQPEHGFNAMIIAAKPIHPSFGCLGRTG